MIIWGPQWDSFDAFYVNRNPRERDARLLAEQWLKAQVSQVINKHSKSTLAKCEFFNVN
jgi:hypothetical protein